MGFLPTLLAVSPFLLFLLLLFWKKSSLIWVSLISLLLVILLAAIYWRVYPIYILGSLEKGFFVALDIFIIIFGAIFFLEIVRETKVLENIGLYLESISKDLRIQVILLAWLFENLLEGTAGFGTPSAVVAPLLIGLGLSPINAVIIALMGNSASGVFGAAGTPIKVGYGALAGTSLPFKAAIINSIGILVPIFMLWFLTKDRKNGHKEFIEALPFAIWAGVAFAIPSIFAVFVGQEFPSILGAIASLVLVFITTKLGIFVPKKEKDMMDSPNPARLPLIKVLLPYMLLVVILIVGKFLLASYGIRIPIIIKHTFAFFNPGFVFIVSGIVSLFLFNKGIKLFKHSVKQAFKRSITPFMVIVFMSSIAQIMVNSVNNISSLPSMIDLLAVSIKNTLLPLWAPVIGAFGSFLTGSVTISSIMFGNFLAASARDLGFNVDNILALAIVGAAAGNMIALADIMAAEAVVNLKNEERSVLKGVMFPCLICVILVGLIGIFIL